MHNVINLNERRQQRLHARHVIGDHAATLRALDAEAIEERACSERAHNGSTPSARHVAKVFAMPLKADNPLITRK